MARLALRERYRQRLADELQLRREHGGRRLEQERSDVRAGHGHIVQLAFLKHIVMVSRFVKGRNPRLLPE